MRGNAVAGNAAGAAAVGNNVDTANYVVVGNPRTSNFKNVMKKFKYTLPVLMVLAPVIWLMGGFSGWGASSPLGLDVF